MEVGNRDPVVHKLEYSESHLKEEVGIAHWVSEFTLCYYGKNGCGNLEPICRVSVCVSWIVWVPLILWAF